ncbi:MAG: hypothetical protein ACR2FI_13340 [Burkholderiales bacterium]
MKILQVLRLLLDIYGALFLLVIAGGAAIGGLLPYHSFIELGTIGFYATLGFGFALWLVLAAVMRRKTMSPATSATATPPAVPPEL